MIFGNKSRRDQRDIIIKYKRVFGTPEGKEVLYDILNRAYVLNPLPTDSELKFKRAEGLRVLGLSILHNCEIGLKQLDELLRGENQ